jgi:alkanesulfonate monooxygenase SsuD/methylene tetrahydromethanopterin reductase-like flavin-dependent oxidoreductase (luciferase family)
VTGIEAFSVLGAASRAAPGVGLGTGVLAMQVRTPPLLAMAAASLQALAPDREVLLGVGVSSPVVACDWHGASYPASPLAHMREFIALLRECLSGNTVTFAGDYYQVRKFRLGVEPVIASPRSSWVLSARECSASRAPRPTGFCSTTCQPATSPGA